MGPLNVFINSIIQLLIKMQNVHLHLCIFEGAKGEICIRIRINQIKNQISQHS